MSDPHPHPDPLQFSNYSPSKFPVRVLAALESEVGPRVPVFVPGTYETFGLTRRTLVSEHSSLPGHPTRPRRAHRDLSAAFDPSVLPPCPSCRGPRRYQSRRGSTSRTRRWWPGGSKCGSDADECLRVPCDGSPTTPVSSGPVGVDVGWTTARSPEGVSGGYVSPWTKSSIGGVRSWGLVVTGCPACLSPPVLSPCGPLPSSEPSVRTPWTRGTDAETRPS